MIGGGKTGIDACQRSLELSADPDQIHWITPCEVWPGNRENTQPMQEVFDSFIRAHQSA